MRFLDLHCDTVTECTKRGCSMQQNPLHLDLLRANQFSEYVQVFAIWIPDDIRGADAWDYFQKNADFFDLSCRDCSLLHCREFSEIETALAQDGRAAILSVEGGAVLGGKTDRLHEIYDRGVHILTLTWNGENELGFGCQSEDAGLKPFGKQVLSEMERLHMIPDVSHLNRSGFFEVLERCGRPVLASHSTSFTVLQRTRKASDDKDFAMRRALTDDQIRALAEHGGLIGLNLCASFLGDPGDDGAQAALRHAQHILEIGGENILAIGSDFDGCEMHDDLHGIEKMPSLYAYFLHNGFSEALCEKIFFENGLHFFKSML